MSDAREAAARGGSTSEVVLRDVIYRDFPIFFEQQLDPDAIRMAAFPARDRQGFVAHWAKILRDPAIAKKTVVFRGRVAGNIVCWEQSGQQLVGYWIGKKYWGQGIATRALADFLAVVTTRPLHARVAKHNLGSIRVLEKCGFVRAGEDTIPAEAGSEPIEEWVMELA